jgi:hypothetical protein
MTDFQRPEGWTDEQVDAYFGSADDPNEDDPIAEDNEIVDLYALYDASANEGGGDEGTVA